MNFIEGRVDHDARRFVSDGLTLDLDEPHLARLTGRDLVTLGIRPEHIEVSTAEHPGWLTATVHVTELMGNETFVFLRAGSQKIIARAVADFRAEFESAVFVKIRMERVDFFDSNTGERI